MGAERMLQIGQRLMSLCQYGSSWTETAIPDLPVGDTIPDKANAGSHNPYTLAASSSIPAIFRAVPKNG